MEHIFRVVTRGIDHAGLSYIYRDDKEYCGPFLTRSDALATVAALLAAQSTHGEG
jgi:hypothetical protein